MNLRVRSWRFTVAHSKHSLAVSLWRRENLLAGAGVIVIRRGRFHAFADLKGRTWAYVSGLGWMT